MLKELFSRCVDIDGGHIDVLRGSGPVGGANDIRKSFAQGLFLKSPTGTDGDGDGMIYDGTPQERPAPKPGDKVEVRGSRGPTTVTLGELEGERFNDFDSDEPDVVVSADDIEAVETVSYSWDEEEQWGEWEDSKFGYNEKDDDYLYHVTPSGEDVESSGLSIGHSPTITNYGGYSDGKVFLTERSGVNFWHTKIVEHSEANSDDPTPITVVRVRKEDVKGTIQTDTEGTRDAPGTAYFVSRDEDQPGVDSGKAFTHNSKVGDWFVAKAYGLKGDMRFEIKDIHRDSDGNDTARISDGYMGADVPVDSLEQLYSDTTGDYSYLKQFGESKSQEVNAVISGKASFLGKGADGVVHDVGNGFVVKSSTTVPYHPVGSGRHSTPAEAVEVFKNKIMVERDMFLADIPGVMKTRNGMHGNKIFSVREKLDVDAKLSESQLDQLRVSLNAIHDAGFSVNDEIQVGVSDGGDVFHFDLGQASPGATDGDKEDDLSSLRRFIERNSSPEESNDISRDARKMIGSEPFTKSPTGTDGDGDGMIYDGTPQERPAGKSVQTETKAFKKWFGDSKLKGADGKPMVLYHGTTADFEEFNVDSDVNRGDMLGTGVYLSTSSNAVRSYAHGETGNIKPLYVRAENIFDIEADVPEGQVEAMSRVLSKGGGGSYHESTRITKRFPKSEKQKAYDLFDERDEHFIEFGEGYDRYSPRAGRDGDMLTVEYSDPDVVAVPKSGRELFDRLHSKYGVGYTKELAKEGIDAIQSGHIVVVTDSSQIKSAIGNRGTFDSKSGDIRKSIISGLWLKSPTGTDGDGDGMIYDGTPNEQPDPNATKTPQIETREFKNWFGDWVNDPENASKILTLDGDPQTVAPYSLALDEHGKPQVAYHGTTHEFDVFEEHRGNVENDIGVGHYFTESLGDVDANYAGEGPDLTNRVEQYRDRVGYDIEQVKEQLDERLTTLEDSGETFDNSDVDDILEEILSESNLEQSDELEEVLTEYARSASRDETADGLTYLIARKKLVGGEPRTIDAYLNIRNPVVLGDPEGSRSSNETVFTIEEVWEDEEGRSPDDPDYDEDSAYPVDETGSGVMLHEAMTSVAYKYGIDGQEAFNAVMEDSYDGVRAIDVKTRFSRSNMAFDATDEDGNLASSEYIREVFEEIGFDGVVYEDASNHFKNMGIPSGTRHFVAFKPNQIKSASGNSGEFNPDDPNIYKSVSQSSFAKGVDSETMFRPGVNSRDPKRQAFRSSGIDRFLSAMWEKSPTGTDGDGDGMIYDGTPQERPVGMPEYDNGWAPKWQKSPDPARFIDSRDNVSDPAMKPFLSMVSPDDLVNHDIFLSSDSKIGVAVSPDGDIQNVFNNGGPKGSGQENLIAAVQGGGKTLDCFDGFLPKYYHNFGFTETGRMKFNREYAPDGWNYDRFGEPDVVFMARTNDLSEKEMRSNVQRKSREWETPERSKSYSEDWDGQKQQSRDRAEASHQRGVDGTGSQPDSDADGDVGGTLKSIAQGLFTKSPTGTDGDRDGMIYDGTPQEQPAPREPLSDGIIENIASKGVRASIEQLERHIERLRSNGNDTSDQMADEYQKYLDKKLVTRSPEFKSWFGDWEDDPESASKVVDDFGEPQEQGEIEDPEVMYHGTSFGGWDTFEERWGQQTGQGDPESLLYGPGFYFTDDKEKAADYMKMKATDVYETSSTAQDFLPILNKLKTHEDRELQLWIDADMEADAGSIKSSIRRIDEIQDLISRYPEGHDVSGNKQLLQELHWMSQRQDLETEKFVLNDADRNLVSRGTTGEVKQAYLNIRKPFDIGSDVPDSVVSKIRRKVSPGSLPGDPYSSSGESVYLWLSGTDGGKVWANKMLQGIGYDGITHIGGAVTGTRKHRVFIAFKPNQVKSINNEGSFDPKSDSMMKSFVDGLFLKSPTGTDGDGDGMIYDGTPNERPAPKKVTEPFAATAAAMGYANVREALEAAGNGMLPTPKRAFAGYVDTTDLERRLLDEAFNKAGGRLWEASVEIADGANKEDVLKSLKNGDEFAELMRVRDQWNYVALNPLTPEMISSSKAAGPSQVSKELDKLEAEFAKRKVVRDGHWDVLKKAAGELEGDERSDFIQSFLDSPETKAHQAAVTLMDKQRSEAYAKMRGSVALKDQAMLPIKGFPGGEEFFGKAVAAHTAVKSMVHKDVAMGAEIDIRLKEGRAHYDPATKSVVVREDERWEVIAHEMGHAIDHNNPALARRAREFREMRVAASKTDDVPMSNYGDWFHPREYGNEDSFNHSFSESTKAYTGKVYHDGATEILSVGIESMLLGDGAYSKFRRDDPEYMAFVVGSLNGEFLGIKQ